MTKREAVLLDFVQLIAIGVGVYVGTKGRFMWAVVLVPVVLVAPFTIYRLVRYRREATRTGDATPTGT